LRFPCPASVDGDDYAARLELLARDTAHLAPALLRKACDLAAQTARGMPYASELLNAAATIIEHRQAATRDDRPTRSTQLGDKEAAYASGNLTALGKGMRLMMTSKGDGFRLGDIGERRGIRDNGSAIEPWFHHSADGDGIPSGWYCLKPDASVLADCYRQSRAPFRMDGCRILAA
jgi:hypothetical protein